jgi:4-hydroxy-4-methyl-2-oxoglutarate aldolase
VERTSPEFYRMVEERLYTSVLADVMDDLGYHRQVMRHDIRPLYEGARVAGRAATMLAAEVYEVPAEPFKLELDLLDSIEPGEVVVCTTQGSMRAAMWGELLSTHTKARGGRGAIIDGLTRDAWGIVDIPFPVFVAGYTPADSKGRLDTIAIRVPIEAGGVLVHDGDLVVGDVDGCLAVPQAVEGEVIERAIAKVEGEDEVREVLRAGASISKVFKDYGIL